MRFTTLGDFVRQLPLWKFLGGKNPGQMKRNRQQAAAVHVETLSPRVMLAADGFELNNTWQTASDLGVIPGTNISGVNLDVPADEDWYAFQLIKNDDVNFQINFNAANGALGFEIAQIVGGSPVTIGTSTPNGTGAGVDLAGLTAGKYYMHVTGGGNVNDYGIRITPAATSSTRLFYVNDNSTANGFYTSAVGSTLNAGHSPVAPAASVQQILDNNDIGPGDLILVDTGVYAAGFTLAAADEGGVIAGSPAVSRINGTVDLVDSDFNTIHLMTLGNTGTSLKIRGTGIDATSNTVLSRLNVLTSGTGFEVRGGIGNVIEDTTIQGNGSYGVYMPEGGQLLVRRSNLANRNAGIYAQGALQVDLQNNTISAVTYAVYAAGGTNPDGSGLLLTNNVLKDAQYGVFRNSGGMQASNNDVFNNNTGIYVGGSVLSSSLTNNSIHNNTLGLQGFGTFGGTDWSQANQVYSNQTGIKPDDGSIVQFNVIDGNSVGIQSDGPNTIRNNLIKNNSSSGILVSAVNGVDIINNTIVTTAGHGVRLQNSAYNVELRNNIFSTTGGFGLYVAPDSQREFASDYNNHFSSNGSTLIWWQKSFTDIFDWQVEADYDRHSIGTTAIAPSLDDPQFVNPGLGNYRLQATSTSIDAGNPIDVFVNETGVNGNRIDLGAYGNTFLAAQSQPQRLKIEYPNFYSDWPADVGRSILWNSFDSGTFNNKLAGPVVIDLYKEGVGFLVNITTTPATNESFGWSPSVSGIVGNTTDRYWIRISSQANPAIFVESREKFSVPPVGTEYYVNDQTVAGGDITTAAGDNRHTGKSASDPKANLLPVLRSYDLGPADNVSIDAGEYIHVRNVVLTGNLTDGDDEGMTITGPTDPARKAILDRANTSTDATAIELNDADFVTLKYLTVKGGDRGIWVHNGSTFFDGNHLTVSNNARDGIRLESDASSSEVNAIHSHNNGGVGVFIATPIASLSNSSVHDNVGNGIQLSNTGATVLEGNTVYNNQIGIQAVNTGTTTVIGNADLSLGLGNKVYNNRSHGVYAQGNVNVVGNTISGHTSSNSAGVEIGTSANATDNVVFGNFYGINGNSSNFPTGSVLRNRVYGNSVTGIRMYNTVPVTGNVVYSNATGIDLYTGSTGRYTGTAQNNLVYSNSTQGIRLEGLGAKLVNNTVYQTTGDAVVVTGSSTNVELRNNILWVESGHDINVNANSQVGFKSDYNLLYTTGTGKVAFWQGAARNTLNAWYNTVFQDANSLAQNPQFVDADGADNVLGDDINVAGDTAADDDFHLQSDYSSFHGGSLAPILDGVTGLPVAAMGSWVVDGLRSPGIDRGDSADAPTNEPAANGGYANLGAFGRTTQASKSPPEYVLITRPDGGEIWPAKQSFPVRWRSHDNVGTVDIDLYQVGNPVPVATIADNVANNGEYLWSIPQATVPATNYFVRVTRNDGVILSDDSNAVFEITEPITIYYVNDGSLVGDQHTTAIGDNANSGLTPNAPKASIAAILAAYDLEPGDIIQVDVGTYNLAGNTTIAVQDSGVKIQGPSSGVALINRSNTNSGSYAFELSGADDVTISGLSITGGQYGVFASGTADSDNFRLENSKIFGNLTTEVLLNATNDFATLQGNSISGNASIGISILGQDADLIANDVTGHTTGIKITGARGYLFQNEVYNNSTGIDAAYTTAAVDRIEIRENAVYRNLQQGIFASTHVLVQDNQVWGHIANTSATGILFLNGVEIRENDVFDNNYGIASSSNTSIPAVVEENRVFNNSVVGIQATYSTPVRYNTVYSNKLGIEGIIASFGNYTGIVANNLVYDNADHAIRIKGGTNAKVENNTIYQLTGNGITIDPAASSSGIQIRNNIVWVEGGFAVSVASNSQTGFSSDYNTFYLPGAGQLGQWENHSFPDYVSWRYEVGQDAQSQVLDPQLSNPFGADGVLGYDSTFVPGTTQIVDDGDANFALNGAWTSVANGAGGDSKETAGATLGGKSATWSFNGLDANSWYEVSLSWPARNVLNTASRFNVYEGSRLVSSQTLNQRTAPNDFADAGSNWERLSTYYVRGGQLKVELTNLNNSTDLVVADSVRIQKVSGDFGVDDNFIPVASSPTIDAGDPSSFYLIEPFANGRRINQGHTGNTPDAINSPTELVQVLSPNGYEKYEVGQTVVINWQASGLGAVEPAALLNVGSTSAVGVWNANSFQTVGTATGTIANAINMGGVTDPAPEAVYQSFSQATSGIGNKLAWQFPATDGDYTIRLHFAEPTVTAANQRKFDVKLQGATIASSYDIYATAGARYKATILSSNVTASSGNGISLELINTTSNGAVLAGIEVLKVNPTGTATLTADIEFSPDNGANWTSVATGVSMDRFGRGQYAWTPSVETDVGLLRVKGNHGSFPTDVSNNTFQIANAGNHYYVNDLGLGGDLYATAIGNNLNNGKSPDKPMKTLAALVDAYDLDAGDIIYVDSGNYLHVRNIVLGSGDSGVAIQGPTVGEAFYNRDNTTQFTASFELVGADDVTISNLTLTGGQYGVFADLTADSDHVTVMNSSVHSNSLGGVRLNTSNDFANISGNLIGMTTYNTSTYGIFVAGTDATIQGNEVYHYNVGIQATGARGDVLSNDVHNNSSGIVASYSGTVADRIEVIGNDVHHNASRGIEATQHVLVSQNRVWGQSPQSTSAIGIIQLNAAEVINNDVFDNNYGIYVSTGSSIPGRVENNRVYHNSHVGITTSYLTPIYNNTVYSNSIGIEGVAGSFGQYRGTISNNLVYGNTNQGIRVNSIGAQINNNTIYQSVGDGVRVQDSSTNTSLRNNIIQVDSGYAISVTSNSQVGFSSDYNTLYTPLSGKLARWQETDITTLADWWYEVGQDQHSLTTDPQFVDPNGADDLLGYISDLIPGTSAIVDNGDPSFSLVGAWSSTATGFGADTNEAGTNQTAADKFARWTFTGLDPNAWYEVAISWPQRNGLYTSSQFRLVENTNTTIYTTTVNQTVAPNDFSDAGANWKRLGVHFIQGSALTVELSNLGTNGSTVSADAVRIQKVRGNRGADDNFLLQASTPTVDKGDPASFYQLEPGVNGRRANLGHTGNTALALQSPAETIQVLSPYNFDKYIVGQTVNVNWQASGIGQSHPALLINTGDAGANSGWIANTFQTVTSSSASFANAVDLSGVTDPAPAAIYQSLALSTAGLGGKMNWSLPTADGNYVLRLHFAEPTVTAANQRKFDVKVQGATLAIDYDVYATAGARFKATVLSTPVTAVGGNGVSIELVNKTAAGAILSGIELLQVVPGGVASPTADVELSEDGGMNWSTIASAVPMDRYGRGTFAWTPIVDTDHAVIRVRANQLGMVSGVNPGEFQVANDGVEYFINDGSTSGDVYTTVAGDNLLNHGKSFDRPMKTLAALLAAYDLDAGDTIYVDTGNYQLLRDIELVFQDSGVQVIGSDYGNSLFNRGNTNSGSYVFELLGGDGITLSRLEMANAQYGIFGTTTSDSDNLAVNMSRLTNNLVAGVYLPASNDSAVLSDNIVTGTGTYGVYALGTDTQVLDSNISGHTVGVQIQGARGKVDGNNLHHNQTGVLAAYTGVAADQIEVRENVIHENSSRGAEITNTVLVINNDVWGQNGSGDAGIFFGGSPDIVANQVHGNAFGIMQNSGTTGTPNITANRVYNNSASGIRVTYQSPVSRNYVYSNSIGIEGDVGSFGNYQGSITNNLVYANTNQGIRIAGNGGKVINNTVFQLVGNAVLVEGSSTNVSIRNNILWVEAGYDIYVNSNSQSGFDSDYNVLYSGPDANAFVGFWGNTTRDTLANWQAANSKDAHSNDSNPNFIDVDGADNILGYSTSGDGYNGGADDNFYQAKLSPAIDAGDAWVAPSSDIVFHTRKDDLGVANTGSLDYVGSNLGVNSFASVGSAQTWRSNGTSFTLNFPVGFSFPFYGTNYSSVSVSTEGYLYFSGPLGAGSGANTTALLQANRIIAPLWDNLRTNNTGDDIFVDTSVAGRVTIRWNATNENGTADANFSAVLFNTGNVEFHYGAGNTGLTPTIGISKGDGTFFVLGAHDAQATLTNANSLRFELTPGLTYVDIGAYEFPGSSTDNRPPHITTTLPSVIDAGGTTGELISDIKVDFNEELNPIDANAPGNYELRRAVNGVFGDGDDVIYNLTPTYVYNAATTSSRTTLNLGINGVALPAGTYQLTIHGNAASSLHDTAGLRLDGSGDGTVTGNLPDEYVRTFVVNAAGIEVSAISGATTEAGGTASFSVVLKRQPTADVTIPISSSNTAEGTVSVNQLVFTPANWETPQTVTVTGIDELIDDGDTGFSILTGAATSVDPLYSGLNAADVAVTNLDDDTFGISLTPISGNTSEIGGSAQFSVVLLSQPTADVTLSIASSDTTEGTTNVNQLVFTAGNWNVPQTVTVNGVDDVILDGDINYSIQVGPATSADATYNGVDPSDPTLLNLDNEVSGNDAPVLSGSTAVLYTEDQAAALLINKEINVSDVDSPFLGVGTVKIVSNYEMGADVLTYNPVAAAGNIAGVFNAATGELVLASPDGTATSAKMQAALRAVIFSNTSNQPSLQPRLVTFQVTDGSAQSNLITSQVNIIPVNDKPVTGAGPVVNYAEQQAPVFVAPAITLSDSDSATMAYAIVKISQNFSAGNDVLSFVGDVTTGNIVGSFNSTSGSLVLYSPDQTATVAEMTSAVRKVTFHNNRDNPSTLTRQISYQVSDGIGLGTATFSTVQFAASNDAPTLAGAGLLVYTKNQVPTAIQPNMTLADIDSTTLAWVKATITANYVAGHDVLSFIGSASTGDIVGNFDAPSGQITLTSPSGTATLSQFQSALSIIRYHNTNNNPPLAPRVVSYQIHDGALASNVATAVVTIKGVSNAPVVANATSVIYTEGQPGVAVNDLLTVSDSDSATLVYATLKISGNFSSTQDLLEFAGNATTGNIVGAYNPKTGTLMLTSQDGSATVAQFQNALRLVTYRNTSIAPSQLVRTVQVQVNDGTIASAILSTTITVSGVNNAPVLVGGSAITVTEGQAAAVVNSGISVSDVDNFFLPSATVKIAFNYAAGEDVLSFAPSAATGNITGSWNAATGELTLSSLGPNATPTQFQAALRLVKFQTTGDNVSALPRLVEFQITDGTSPSNTLTSLVTVVPVNDAPVVSGSNVLNYTEQNPAAAINPTINVNDADHTSLAFAIVKISNNFKLAEDSLGFVGDGTTGNIVGTYNPKLGSITLISPDGTASVAEFQAALRKVTYFNSANGPTLLPRTVTYQVSDGRNLSALASSTVNIIGENDGPVLVGTGAVTYTKNAPAIKIHTTIGLADADSVTMAFASVRVATNYVNGDDLLGFVPVAATGDIVGNFNAATGVMTLTSPSNAATVAQFQAAMAAVTYRNLNANPITAPRLVEYKTNDGVVDSNTVVALVTIKGTGPAPLLAVSGNATYQENQPAVVINSGVTLSDVDSATLAFANVKISVNNQANLDVLEFTPDGTTGNIQGSFNAKTATFTLISPDGTATVAQFQAALRKIKFYNTSDAPSLLNRTVTFQVSDGTTLSNLLSNTVAVIS